METQEKVTDISIIAEKLSEELRELNNAYVLTQIVFKDMSSYVQDITVKL